MQQLNPRVKWMTILGFVFGTVLIGLGIIGFATKGFNIIFLFTLVFGIMRIFTGIMFYKKMKAKMKDINDAF
jgi:uncharacterized membrane protein